MRVVRAVLGLLSMLKLTSPGRPRSHPCRDGTASCRCGVGGAAFLLPCHCTYIRASSTDDFTLITITCASLAHRHDRPGSLLLFISLDPVVAHLHPHISTQCPHSQSPKTWTIKCEDYCRRLSASLGPLMITLATTGIYNYNTLFWSSTSFPLLLSLLLRIPPASGVRGR